MMMYIGKYRPWWSIFSNIHTYQISLSVYIFQYTHLAKFTMVAKCVYFPIFTLSEIYHGW